LGHAVIVEGADGRHEEAGRKLQAKGKTVDFKELLRMEPDGHQHPQREEQAWARRLGPEHRCVVPVNSFSEFNKAEGGDIWFALDETRPLACFAGIWTNWTSVRKVKEGETTNDIFAFLTTEPNAEVGAMHPKAMPVILTTPGEVESWMTAAPDEALKLLRPLPDGRLQIVARGVKEDRPKRVCRHLRQQVSGEACLRPPQTERPVRHHSRDGTGVCRGSACRQIPRYRAGDQRKMNSLGLYTGLDMRKQSLEFMQANFGKAGEYYYWISRFFENTVTVRDEMLLYVAQGRKHNATVAS
jgi:hypothetical protein